MSTIVSLDRKLDHARSTDLPLSEIGSNNFDFLRLFAATQVVIFHAINHLGIQAPLWTYPFKPFSGVPIFFVVSGFLTTASYERSSSIFSYFEKRARRIFPGLWFCIIVSSVLFIALGYPIVSPQGAAWFLTQFAALIYTPEFLKSFGFGSYNGSLWTIPIELQFYFTVPILSFFVRRASNKTVFLAAVLTVAMFIGIAVRVAVPSIIITSSETIPDKLIRYSFYTHYFEFALGAVAYYLAFHQKSWLKGKAVYWLIPVLGMHLFAPYSAFTVVLSQIFLGLFALSAAFTAAGVIRLRGFDISYGVYLYHGPILGLLIMLGFTGMPMGLYILLPTAYLAGCFSWFFVESRFLKRNRTRSSHAVLSQTPV